MPLPGRQYNAGDYRHGFNGMEKDDELKGNGNSYDFGARIYDSRVARFLSIDPRSSEFPWMSPYVFAANNPMRYIDVNGEGPGDPWTKKGLQQIINSSTIAKSIESKVYDNPKSGFSSRTNPLGTSKDRSYTDARSGRIFIPNNFDNSEASVLYVYELQHALNFEKAREFQGLIGKGGSEQEYVKLAIELETEAFITAIQYQNEQKLDVLSGENKKISKLVKNYSRKYLQEGELITESNPDKGSKQEKALREIYSLSSERQTENFESIYKTQYRKEKEQLPQE